MLVVKQRSNGIVIHLGGERRHRNCELKHGGGAQVHFEVAADRAVQAAVAASCAIQPAAECRRSCRG